MIEQHYTTLELAERLAVHPETIRRAASRGELQSVRIGRDRRFSETAVAEWLRSLSGERDAACIRKRRPHSYQVRVTPFPAQTLPTREAAERLELELKLRKVGRGDGARAADNAG